MSIPALTLGCGARLPNFDPSYKAEVQYLREWIDELDREPFISPQVCCRFKEKSSEEAPGPCALLLAPLMTVCLCNFYQKQEREKELKCSFAKDSRVCHVVLGPQIPFYLTIEIKLPRLVHRRSFSHSPFPYLDHVEFPEKGSKLSDGGDVVRSLLNTFHSERKRQERRHVEFHLHVLSEKHIHHFFYFLKGGYEPEVRVCMCVCKLSQLQLLPG